MGWLERIRKDPTSGETSGTTEEAAEGPARRSAPGLAAAFRGLGEDPSHAVLDLGPASQAHLRVYGRFARRIRFADLLPEPPRGTALGAALADLRADSGPGYDVVLMWNLLDHITRERRVVLIERLAKMTAPGARLYAVVDASRGSTVQPVRFTPLAPDRVSHEPVGRPRAGGRTLLPAEMERLLDPFHVSRAFTLRTGEREYVAVKAEG